MAKYRASRGSPLRSARKSCRRSSAVASASGVFWATSSVERIASTVQTRSTDQGGLGSATRRSQSSRSSARSWAAGEAWRSNGTGEGEVTAQAGRRCRVAPPPTGNGGVAVISEPLRALAPRCEALPSRGFSPSLPSPAPRPVASVFGATFQPTFPPLPELWTAPLVPFDDPPSQFVVVCIVWRGVKRRLLRAAIN